MKYTRPKNKLKIIVPMVAAAILLIAALVFYFVQKHNTSTSNDALLEQIQSQDESRQRIINDDANSYNESEDTERSNSQENKNLIPENKEDASSKPITPTIARVSQDQNGTIEVVATFDTTANGTCRLTLSKSGSQTVTRESPITVGPSYYVCGFTVNNATGTGWTASVQHVNNDQVSDSVSQEIK